MKVKFPLLLLQSWKKGPLKPYFVWHKEEEKLKKKLPNSTEEASLYSALEYICYRKEDLKTKADFHSLLVRDERIWAIVIPRIKSLVWATDGYVKWGISLYMWIVEEGK